jgi:hypothetical protein
LSERNWTKFRYAKALKIIDYHVIKNGAVMKRTLGIYGRRIEGCAEGVSKTVLKKGVQVALDVAEQTTNKKQQAEYEKKAEADFAMADKLGGVK